MIRRAECTGLVPDQRLRLPEYACPEAIDWRCATEPRMARIERQSAIRPETDSTPKLGPRRVTGAELIASATE